MASTPPDPKNIQGRLDQVYGAAEALRKHSLTQLAEEEKGDVDLLQEVRAELAREVGENDPRVRALDRRIAGSIRFVEIAREVAGEAALKEPDRPKEPQPAGGQRTDKTAKPAKKQPAKKE